MLALYKGLRPRMEPGWRLASRAGGESGLEKGRWGWDQGTDYTEGYSQVGWRDMGEAELRAVCAGGWQAVRHKAPASRLMVERTEM